jgi:hypothetical protein
LFKAKIISISNGVDCCTPGISGLDYISWLKSIMIIFIPLHCPALNFELSSV